MYIDNYEFSSRYRYIRKDRKMRKVYKFKADPSQAIVHSGVGLVLGGRLLVCLLDSRSKRQGFIYTMDFFTHCPSNSAIVTCPANVAPTYCFSLPRRR